MKAKNPMSTRAHPRRFIGAALAAVLLFTIASSPSWAETRGYIISELHTATYPTADDCPKGGNGNFPEIRKHILLSRGFTEAQADAIGDGYGENKAAHKGGPTFDFERRGTMDGKPVDIEAFPASEPDPQMQTVEGHYAYGFDLTGHPTPYSFEDPDTHQMVENQMWRVLGCLTGYRVKPPVYPFGESVFWDTAEDSMPAWLISISGEDLSKDGPVTVTFDRSLDIAIRNTKGSALSGSSYTIDPDSSSHSAFKGYIKNRVLTIEPGDFYLQGESQFYPQLRFKQTHLRLEMMPDGRLRGFLGGYQPWLDYYHYLAILGEEPCECDLPAIYWAMKRLADGIPDPVTGQNTGISSAYYFEAVPAFLSPVSHVVVAESGVGIDREALKVSATTPEGITLVEVMRPAPLSEPQFIWNRLGDAGGQTLLISDKDPPGRSSCDSTCAQEFPPLFATACARAFGDWSVIRRSDGTRQWAYQSHALYTWTKEKKPGEVAINVGLEETANLKLAEEAAKAGSLLPPAGWRVAKFVPAASLQLPEGIDARLVSSAQAVVLTDTEGMTLYAFNGEAKRDGQMCAMSGDCKLTWLPVQAPALALTTGDFSVVTRPDGSKQWAYQHYPLYLYSGDKLPGDALGLNVDKRWSAAELSELFRPKGVTTTTLNGYGDVLTADGMSLYGGYIFEERLGGRDLRNTFTDDYVKGKALGADACARQACLDSWHPFLAPASAKPNGFWEPIARSDGSKQWAYKGYAVYTYAGDKVPGDHNGQGRYEFALTEGSAADLKRTAFLFSFGKTEGGPGIYWNLLKPTE
jgi:predicted lipoprotein with Yx(FWY)xxD motif